MDGNITNPTNVLADQPTAMQSRTEKVTAAHLDVEDFEFVDEEKVDMAHEIKMLKEQVLHLNTELGRMKDLQQQNGGQATGTVPVPHTKRDLGEIVKPSLPSPNRIGGNSYLQPFLTQLRVYFMFFPSHFTSDTDKILFAFGLLNGSILRWFEPTARAFINDPEGASQDVKDLMTNYRAFELALLMKHGTNNEQQYAEDELKKL